MCLSIAIAVEKGKGTIPVRFHKQLQSRRFAFDFRGLGMLNLSRKPFLSKVLLTPQLRRYSGLPNSYRFCGDLA